MAAAADDDHIETFYCYWAADERATGRSGCCWQHGSCIAAVAAAELASAGRTRLWAARSSPAAFAGPCC